jgi:hypothetical protein
MLLSVLGVGLSAQADGPSVDGCDKHGPKTEAQATVAVNGQKGSEVQKATVTERLMKVGMSRAQADQKVERLTASDIQKLADSPQSIERAGIKDRTLVIIALILILPSILLLAAI